MRYCVTKSTQCIGFIRSKSSITFRSSRVSLPKNWKIKSKNIVFISMIDILGRSCYRVKQLVCRRLSTPLEAQIRVEISLQSWFPNPINLLTLFLKFPLLAIVFQAGKVNITDTSQNNHGCQSVSFKTQFQGSDVKVFASLSHGNTYVKIHDPAALWVKSVSTTGFEVCAREAGSGSGGTSVINWLAFQGSHQGIQSGIVDFDEWTTTTQCKRVSIGNQSNVSSDLFSH